MSAKFDTKLTIFPQNHRINKSVIEERTLELSKLSVRERVKSAGYAVQGIAAVVRSQPNTWYMIAATIGVVVAGLWFKVGPLEWCCLSAAIAVVWLAEILNSAIEFLTDLVSPEHHPLAQKAKDAAAAAALIAVLFALVVGIVILLPKMIAALS